MYKSGLGSSVSHFWSSWFLMGSDCYRDMEGRIRDRKEGGRAVGEGDKERKNQ